MKKVINRIFKAIQAAKNPTDEMIVLMFMKAFSVPNWLLTVSLVAAAIQFTLEVLIKYQDITREESVVKHYGDFIIK